MKLKIPLVVVNFKTYREATGKGAIDLARICEKIAGEMQINMAVAVQNPDIYRVSRAVSIPVFSQHVDHVTYGAYTGHILPEAVKENGAYGVLVNHSEHKLGIEKVKNIIQRAKEAGLVAVACAPSPLIVSKIARLSPDAIAIEPPELIGGNVSVTSARPDIISASLKAAGKIPLLCGAGIKTKEDVRTALMLGAKGVLLASGVVKAESPARFLTELSKGFYIAHTPYSI